MNVLRNHKQYDVAVIGGGAAGMMAAGTAASMGLDTVLIEKNDRLGRKLGITGKGRCNVTNHSDVAELIAAVTTNGRFLYSAFSRFTAQDTMAFFERLGVPLKTERGGRVFPQSDKASDIVQAMGRFLKENGADIIFTPAESLLIESGRVNGVKLVDGQELRASHVIVACGGCSYPGTGSTGDGYRFARQAGHTVTELRPSLVPLVAQGWECPEMQGLSLKNIAVTVTDTVRRKKVYDDFGELLFTHFGLSGPVILSASTHMKEMKPGRYEVSIDLKPALSPEQLDARLCRDFAKNQNRNFANSLSELLPRKMIPVMVKLSGISPDCKCNQISREQRLAFGRLLKGFRIVIQGFRPIAEAIVTSGGVAVKEVNPKTMASKLVEGLSFAGEVLDVDAYTGGFNLQIAFSTGYLAAVSQKKEEQHDSGSD